MTQQLATGGDDKFITIRGELQNFRTLRVTPFQIIIKDNYAVASFIKKNFARKMVRNEIRHGNKNIKYNQVIDSAIEHYPGKNKEQIAKIVGKSLREGGAKIKK